MVKPNNSYFVLNRIPGACNERMSGIDSKIVSIFYNLKILAFLKATLES